jgi:hypothetical protein
MGGSLTYQFNGRSVFRLELPRAIEDADDDRTPIRTTVDEAALTMRTVGSGRIGVS